MTDGAGCEAQGKQLAWPEVVKVHSVGNPYMRIKVGWGVQY